MSIITSLSKNISNPNTISKEANSNPKDMVVSLYARNIIISLGAGIFCRFAGRALGSIAFSHGILDRPDIKDVCLAFSKIHNYQMKISILAPAQEEFLFRYGLQELLLKKIANYLPSNKTLINSKVYAAVRVVFTAALFASMHYSNINVLPEPYVKFQIASSFISGLVYGILKESQIGLLGAMGAHATKNILNLLSLQRLC